MSNQTRTLAIIRALTGKFINGNADLKEQRIIDSFFLTRNDLTSRLEFVADKTDPSEEEKARVFIEAMRQFGQITVSGQAFLTKQQELKPQFDDAEESARQDFSEVK